MCHLHTKVHRELATNSSRTSSVASCLVLLSSDSQGAFGKSRKCINSGIAGFLCLSRAPDREHEAPTFRRKTLQGYQAAPRKVFSRKHWKVSKE